MTNEEILAHYRERYPYISLGRAWGVASFCAVPAPPRTAAPTRPSMSKATTANVAAEMHGCPERICIGSNKGRIRCHVAHKGSQGSSRSCCRCTRAPTLRVGAAG
jgi:hypothetical protein